MNILHINSNYMHSRLHSEFLNELQLLNVSNKVIMPRKIGDEKHVIDNLDIQNVFHKNLLKRTDRFFYFRKQNKIMKWLSTLNLNMNQFDMIHAHTLFSDGYIAYRLNKPYVVTVRNTDVNFYMKFYKHLLPLGRKILKSAARIIFLSDSYQNKTIESLFKNSFELKDIIEKTIVIPNGINEFWIDNANNEKRKIGNHINILCVSRVMKNKNLDFLVRNLNDKSLESKVNIYIIGEILDYKYYKRLSRYTHVHFLNKRCKEEIKSLMSKMDIFALVSHSETFGLVYLEALTQNLPLIYTKGEGFDNYFEEGFAGYAVSPHDDKQLVQSVLNIMNRYEKIQENISRIDKSEFSWKSVALKHKRIYEKIKACE